MHRHLDWLSPTEWLDYNPYLILESHGSIKAIFVCPPEAGNFYWIRIFASKDAHDFKNHFMTLFNSALNLTRQKNEPACFVCIGNHDWMRTMLIELGWKRIQDVVQLKWNSAKINMKDFHVEAQHKIRPMKLSEIRRVAFVDQSSFEPIWQHSEHALRNAFAQSSYCSVCEIDQIIVGYQISTSFQHRAHIARLAVLPEFQGRRLGMALVVNALKHFKKPWINEITVNTQSDNRQSLSIYEKLGFEYTADQFPIYSYQ